jgi:outer membrane protein TolC
LRELEFVKAQQVLAVKNTDLVRRKLEAETSRFRVGRGSGFQLSAAQNELTLAENAEIEASLAIQRSLLEFHRANGTLALKRMSVLGRP